METKYCNKCKTTKSTSEFYPRPGNKFRSWCINCTKDVRNAYGKTKNAKQLARLNARTLTGKFCTAQAGARRRGLDWKLTKDEYNNLVNLNECYYCGSSLPEVGTGLDRIDNDKGYISGNVVPCCEVCNTVKSNFFTKEEMIEIGILIKNIRLRRLNEKENTNKTKS